MVNSMTGFAALKGALESARWHWELRSVNARGLDIRLRLPEGLGDLEQVLRKSLTAEVTRGNITLSLRLFGEVANSTVSLDLPQLEMIMSALKTVDETAQDAGVHLTASTGADILALRGVLEVSDTKAGDQDAVIKALKLDIAPLIEAFIAARAAEGEALGEILSGQLSQIVALISQALKAAENRQVQVAETFRLNLAKILDNSEGADENRVAQELAMLAVKADISEEIDRLKAHCDAANSLLTTAGPVGRKFDFLMQEFNREANTLCSKSGSKELTKIGLDLKTVIDQMREQVQNVE
ncbi:MAG: YicC family protein [Alphaproteobacteria bacterium]|nr:YicC family protein [Alphaproteobacteria bacterium]